jgi:hypothetical protein
MPQEVGVPATRIRDGKTTWKDTSVGQYYQYAQKAYNKIRNTPAKAYSQAATRAAKAVGPTIRDAFRDDAEQWKGTGRNIRDSLRRKRSASKRR